MTRSRAVSLWLLAALFVASGLLHFLFPAPYISIVPAFLPAPALLVLLSGVAQILGGVALLFENTRWIAGVGLIMLLLAVWPANLQMLVDARQANVSAAREAVLWLRLPLQLLLILWIGWAARLRA